MLATVDCDSSFPLCVCARERERLRERERGREREMRERMFVDLRTIECRTNRSLHYTFPTHHSLPHTPLLPLYTQN